jgi:hypothetical protein
MVRWVIVVLLVLGAAVAVMPAAAGETTGEFAAIDNYALATPAYATRSIASLSAYLVEPARNDREKARAIFRWITANIGYDRRGEAASCDPDKALRSRRVVCYGYAVLFKALAEAAGMKAEIILGHSPKFKPGTPEDESGWVNHAWNAVQVAGRWQLVDCCWGAGYLDARSRFVQQFCSHYCFTDPATFVYDHFPAQPRWQLLDRPLSRERYLQLAQLRPAFFECGLRLISHTSGVIEADNQLAVTIDAPDETMLIAAVYRDGDEKKEGCALTQRSSSGYVIHARFPAPGAYVLRVFARRKDAPGLEYAWALDYTVRARSGAGDGDGFPKVYGAFLARNCRLDRALSRTLPAGKTAEFALTVPEAEDVVVSTGGSLNHLRGESQRFAGQVPISRGPVVVYARFPGRSMYDGLLQYVGQ